MLAVSHLNVAAGGVGVVGSERRLKTWMTRRQQAAGAVVIDGGRWRGEEAARKCRQGEVPVVMSSRQVQAQECVAITSASGLCCCEGAGTSRSASEHSNCGWQQQTREPGADEVLYYYRARECRWKW